MYEVDTYFYVLFNFKIIFNDLGSNIENIKHLNIS